MSVTAIVLMKAKTTQINELAQAIVAIPGVRDVYSVAGRVDLVAVVHAHKNEDLADLISGKIHGVPGLESSETFIAFRTYCSADVDAGFSLGNPES